MQLNAGAIGQKALRNGLASGWGCGLVLSERQSLFSRPSGNWLGTKHVGRHEFSSQIMNHSQYAAIKQQSKPFSWFY
jgi:hypothetical protein